MSDLFTGSPVPRMREAGLDVKPIPRVHNATPADLRRVGGRTVRTGLARRALRELAGPYGVDRG